MAKKETIGWIGLGKMGVPMAINLVKAGYKVAVFNRTKSKAQEVVDTGATYVDSMAELAAQSDVVISMISDDTVLKTVSTGAGGALEGIKPGSIFIDMSTVSPTASAEVAEAAANKDVAYLRAPVSGSTALATAATLTILASGPKEAFEDCTEIFDAMGKISFHVGTGEEARYLKLTLNMMVGLTAAMVGEALTFGKRGGMDWTQMIDIVSNSVVASPLINYKAQALKDRNFTPAFTAAQMAKDFDIALDAARGMDMPMPTTSMMRQNLAAMKANGDGELDFFAYVTLLEQLAGLKK